MALLTGYNQYRRDNSDDSFEECTDSLSSRSDNNRISDNDSPSPYANLLISTDSLEMSETDDDDIGELRQGSTPTEHGPNLPFLGPAECRQRVSV